MYSLAAKHLMANGRVRAYAKSLGLRIDWENPGSTISKLAWVSQMPREFDFESSHWPSQFHYTGPFHDGMGRAKVDFPWAQLTGEPMVYASMGTVANGRPEIFRTIVSAVAKHKNLQLVLAIGSQLTPEQIGPAPSNAIIVKQAPQLELLKQSSVCITHAGLNMVLEALAQGVPQIAIPVTHDQPGVAARIADKKTGSGHFVRQVNGIPSFRTSGWGARQCNLPQQRAEASAGNYRDQWTRESCRPRRAKLRPHQIVAETITTARPNRSKKWTVRFLVTQNAAEKLKRELRPKD